MSIVDNRKASHDYFIEERYEAGIALQGWEVKAIRAGRAQIGDGYVMVRGEELYLIGAHISPLPTVSTHYTPDPARTRQLLMHAEEIRRLIRKVEQRGYSLIPLNLHYSKSRITLELALATGKLQRDKRAAPREKPSKSSRNWSASTAFDGSSHIITMRRPFWPRLSPFCSINVKTCLASPIVRTNGTISSTFVRPIVSRTLRSAAHSSSKHSRKLGAM